MTPNPIPNNPNRDKPNDQFGRTWLDQHCDQYRTSRIAKSARLFRDPLFFAKLLWPDVKFYNKQREVIYSVRDNFETVVVAGHMLGKDFVTGFIVLWFFLTRHPCRIITTSVDYSQLQGVL